MNDCSHDHGHCRFCGEMCRECANDCRKPLTTAR
ncbi:MAG: four-helix bundle copper-binding protein [Bordetella sp.]|nr:four-helix bundle copper-binding protein [Bordetella sp.]